MSTTLDSLGPLTLEQPARGYRFNEDALLLAEFAGECRGVVFDLGAGVGAVGLTLLATDKANEVVLVERDEPTALLLRANVERNGLGSRARVVLADAVVAASVHPGEASVVVCNPPYFSPGAGRAAAGSKGAARTGEVGVFIGAARALLGKRGRACFVYPASDWTRLAGDLQASGLEPKRARFVHASASSPARVVLVEASAGKPGGLTVEPPLIR